MLASLPVQEMPVFYAPSIDYYVVTRYADVESVFLDPGTSSAAAAQLPLVGNLVRRLLEDRSRWEAIVADRSLIPAAVEETLRYDTSVPV